MDASTSGLPGYRINEYRLVIPLSSDLQEKISAQRRRLHEKYKVKLPFEIPPSLTILKCHAFEKTEPRLIERFQQVTLAADPFLVELGDYAAYPSHTIYIHVPTRSPFSDLVKELKKMKWLMNIHGHEPHFIPEPHLIVAQQLKPMQFINMWLECEHSGFSGRFLADHLLLMKRTPERRSYEEACRLGFLSLPQEIKQGSLFA
jgi:2'-5' RNA ligase